ncbi:acyl-CoA dehydrogenase family protein [Actinomadura harenae]|uniref:Acyl-CoA dehydrogenase C-terminal domain-containing protein n=1 Tax=Actinomadura harenae TaxID=2483351 RepID=A0A3M2M3Y2_9ACTN|nr:hypothetical protein [Actinomadura harenae]RMI43165.1 hypothetical protein EBO15_17165 [Actinomadura harenae]
MPGQIDAAASRQTDAAASEVTTAEAVRSVAAAHASAAEDERRLSAPVVQAITQAGLARLFVPDGFGGGHGRFADLLHQVSTIAEGCASAGWCASLFASHPRMAAFLPPEGRRDLWGDGPDVLISAGVVPGGTVTRCGPGWELGGEWGFVSGVDHADWVLVSGWEPGTTERRLRFFAVPRDECGVRDTWFTTGMRGTGSKTVVLDGVAVPAHRSFAQQDVLAGAPDPDPPFLRVPFRLVNGLTMIAPALGAVRGALHRWTEWVAGKTEMSMGRVVQARDKATVQAALARSATAVDAAELLMGRIARIADSGREVTPGDVARSHRDYAVVAEYLVEAVERLYRVSGARAQMLGGPVERAWRDVHAATAHAALQFDTNTAVYAGHVLRAAARAEPVDRRDHDNRA